MLSKSEELTSAAAQPGSGSRRLARDRLGVLAVLAFIMASVAPLTVAAGVIPTAYAETGADRDPGGLRRYRCHPCRL